MLQRIGRHASHVLPILQPLSSKGRNAQEIWLHVWQARVQLIMHRPQLQLRWLHGGNCWKLLRPWLCVGVLLLLIPGQCSKMRGAKFEYRMSGRQGQCCAGVQTFYEELKQTTLMCTCYCKIADFRIAGRRTHQRDTSWTVVPGATTAPPDPAGLMGKELISTICELYVLCRLKLTLTCGYRLASKESGHAQNSHKIAAALTFSMKR